MKSLDPYSFLGSVSYSFSILSSLLSLSSSIPCPLYSEGLTKNKKNTQKKKRRHYTNTSVTILIVLLSPD